ncbi:MAG TPA: hypothetical protein VK638_38285, partial [Edaphobacter sp.]|nr:hypothetical protein [Edaphobacter sp.]
LALCGEEASEKRPNWAEVRRPDVRDRVNRVILTVGRSLPVFPYKQTFLESIRRWSPRTRNVEARRSCQAGFLLAVATLVAATFGTIVR